MLKPPPHPAEPSRLDTVHELGLQDPWEEACFDRVVRLVKRHFDTPMCGFTVVDTARTRFKARQGIAWPEMPREVSFCAHTILGDDIFEVPNAQNDPRFAGNPFVDIPEGLRYYAGAPVRAPNGLPVGALCLIGAEPNKLNNEQRHALRDFADILQDELIMRNDSVRDHLTRLYNRRFADEFLDREVRRAYRACLPLAILLIDVDHFKAYNDLFGHLGGDEVLRRVARQLDSACRRPGDLVARFGGEEFLCVFPATDVKGARIHAENIRRDIEDLKLPHPQSKAGHITISVGGIVANDLRQLGCDGERLLRTADALLYQAKQNGRNQVVLQSLDEDIV